MDFSEKKNITISAKNLQPQTGSEREDNITLSQEIISGDVSLSFAQQRIWFLEQLAPDSPSNHISDGLLIKGHLDVPSLEKSLNLVVGRHDILRTFFEEKNGLPVQKVLAQLTVHITEVDLREAEEGSKKRKIQELSREHTRQTLNLAAPPLIRLTLIRTGSDEHLLLLTIHRIIADRASIKLLFRELMEFYASISEGFEPQLPDLTVQFTDFSRRQQRSYKSGLFQKQLKYWMDRLSGAPFRLTLPMDRPRPSVQSFNGSIFTTSLEKELSRQLFAFCKKERTTLFVTLLAVFDVLLHRYTREEDILVGTLSPGRKFPEAEALIGLFENSVVHRADLSGDPTFRELLVRVKAACLDSIANQDLPFEKLIEELNPERTLSHSPLVQVMFTLSPKSQAKEMAGVRFENARVDSATAEYEFALEVEEEPDQITLVWKYNADLLEQQTIERMSGNFLALLESIFQNSDQRISKLNILTKLDKEQLGKWNQTGSKFPENRRLEEMFQEQVDTAPRSIAVVAGKRQLTYKELDAKSSQLARYLIHNHIGRGKIIALFMDRSIEMCIALLGIIKSGACYLPIDPTYPSDRIEFMLQDSEASVVVTQKALRSKLNKSIPLICVDSDWNIIQNEKNERPPLQGNSSDLIYVIYTSGSTGIPKGVMVSHRNVVNHAIGVRNAYDLRADDRALQFASISFDVAAEELFSAWLTGSTVVLRTEQMLASFHAFLKEVEKFKINFLNLPTAYWHELVQEIQSSAFEIPSCVRVMVVGGEKVSYSVYKQWLQIAGNSVLFFNGYGPTETTITSTVYKDSLLNRKTAHRIQDVPIGRPITNTQIYVLDPNMQPVPIGVPGELWIGGAGVSCGYLNRKDLTDTSFLPNPFANDPESYIYKTGDVVRYLSDGNLQFFGRIDDQVKIRGFRVELGEIEAALLLHKSVRETTITAPILAGSTHIVAYIVPEDESITSHELRDFLNSKLPDYMIPTTFIFLKNLPLTASGKIDRKNLPLPENLDGELQKNYVPPRDELEVKLAAIWQKMLNVTKVGMKDNFFDLGGHSLLAVRLFSQIEKEIGKNLPLAILFEAPTVEQLANILRHEGWKPHWSSLVPIQPNGKRKPFFCIHAVGGNVIGYQPLAEYLSPDQPVYGLQARGLDGKQTPHVNLEEMAADYIQEIKSVQPNGPYYLGGLSSGGVVAFEMARQLFEMGEKVGIVAMFDTEAPTFIQLVPGIGEAYHRGRSAYLERLKYHLRILFFSKEWKDHVRKKIKTIRRRVRTRLKLATYHLYRKTGKPLPKTLLRVQEASSQALRDYHPGYYPGDLTLFLAIQKSVGEKVPPEIGWKPFARSIKVYSVPGDHLGILEEPNVRVLAESLQECIDEFLIKAEKRTGILMYLIFTLFQVI